MREKGGSAGWWRRELRSDQISLTVTLARLPGLAVSPGAETKVAHSLAIIPILKLADNKNHGGIFKNTNSWALPPEKSDLVDLQTRPLSFNKRPRVN
jgi:hypothetical protein